jgi:hypothetical protein
VKSKKDVGLEGKKTLPGWEGFQRRWKMREIGQENVEWEKRWKKTEKEIPLECGKSVSSD